MSRRLRGSIVISAIVSLLSVVGLILIWRRDELFIGSLYTTVIGLLTVVIAIFIYQEQQLSQESFHQEQRQLQRQLRDRVFGVMDNFEDINLQIVHLIEDANNKPNSRLAIMMYWLWFGIDGRLYENPAVPLDELAVNDSRVRQLLGDRIHNGFDTTVVVYDPRKEDAAVQLKTFIKKVMTWQINRKGIESGGTSSTRNIANAEVNDLFDRYVADLNEVERRRVETRHQHQRFRPLRLNDKIPMLMFALKMPGGESRGLVYLGETDALARSAKTGAFISEDSRFVDVLMEQICKEEPPVSRDVPTPVS